ncbi:LPS-assembly protein LptD [candidate division WOR-3 bacterium]|nr:LPS-assembly protein LptD [candidate division WOR-3 bacterium]
MNILLLVFSFSANNSDPSSIIYYSGNKIFFNVDSSLVQIYGNASAKYGKLSISADTILYSLGKKMLHARGNVLFNDGNSDIKAEAMRYDVNREIGDALHAKTEAENGWFYGEQIRYFKGNILKIKNGYYTTCELDPPHFWFYSPKMRINIDESLVAEPVMLLVRDIPVFFVPFYLQSIKKKRSSGLLRPEFGTSYYTGNYIKKLGWYQTLGEHADIIFYLSYYTRQGIRFNIDQARWNLLPYSRGYVTGNYIKERENDEERWELTVDTETKIPGGINLNVDTKMKSDPGYLKDYEPGEVDRLLQREINYNLNWSGEILNTKTNIVMDHRENLTTDQLYERWPSINMTFPHFRLGGINVRSFYKFTRDQSKHWASGFSGNSNLNLNLFVFNMNMTLNGQSDYYENENVFVNHWRTSTTVKTDIYGLSFFGIPPISKFRHKITPSVSFSYAPVPDSIDVAAISGFYVPSGQKSLNVSVDNLFQCKIGKRRFDFASVRFSSNYRYQDEKFSPVSIYGRFWLGDLFKQDYSTTYDLDLREFGDKRVNTDLRYGTDFGGYPLDFYLTHSVSFTEADRIQQADMGINLSPTPNWKLGIMTHYDFERGKVTSSRINLTRDLHCWELVISVNTFADNWDYSLRLGLKDIPELKIGRETLGGFMP